MSAGFRAAHNRCPIHEPLAVLELSGGPPSVYGSKPGREGRRPDTPDAAPGMLGQPLNATARAVVSGALGGFVSGTLLSVLFLGMEAGTSESSDLLRLKRRTGAKLGRAELEEDKRPRAGEQVFSHSGHLILSAVAGAAYGAAKPAAVRPLVGGTVFGLGFFGIAFGVLGPLLRVTPLLTREAPASNVQHGFLHVLFGITTALVADRVAKRI